MADSNERNLAAAMRRAMLEQGLTQQGLADVLEVRQPTISDILNGKQAMLTPTAKRVLNKLNLKVIAVKRQSGDL